MNSAFKPLVVVFAMVLAMAGLSYWQKIRAEEDRTGVPWRATMADAQKEAAERNRPVVAYFTASWCPPCQQMKESSWPDPAVHAALNDYVPVKVDVDRHPDVAMQFGVNGLPHVQIIGPDGAPGRAYIGFLGAHELVRWLRGT